MKTKAEEQNIKQHSLWWIHGLMILTILLISTSFPVGKLIAGKLPSDVMMMVRFLIAAILFFPFIFAKYGMSVPQARRQLRYAVLSIPLVIFFWCMFEALKYTSALNTGAIYTTVPAITALFALVLSRTKTALSTGLGLVLGTVGALWIVFKGEVSTLLSLELNRGDLIFFCGAIALGLYNVLIKRLYSGEPMAVMTFWVIIYGTLWLTLLSINKLPSITWLNLSIEIYGALFYLALFTTLLSFFLLQFGTIRIGPTKVAAYSFLNPLFVLLVSLLIGLGEFSLSILPGLVLVLIATMIIQREPKTKETSTA